MFSVEGILVRMLVPVFLPFSIPILLASVFLLVLSAWGSFSVGRQVSISNKKAGKVLSIIALAGGVFFTFSLVLAMCGNLSFLVAGMFTLVMSLSLTKGLLSGSRENK